jgi:hypothetical protein
MAIGATLPQALSKKTAAAEAAAEEAQLIWAGRCGRVFIWGAAHCELEMAPS